MKYFLLFLLAGCGAAEPFTGTYEGVVSVWQQGHALATTKSTATIYQNRANLTGSLQVGSGLVAEIHGTASEVTGDTGTVKEFAVPVVKAEGQPCDGLLVGEMKLNKGLLKGNVEGDLGDCGPGVELHLLLVWQRP